MDQSTFSLTIVEKNYVDVQDIIRQLEVYDITASYFSDLYELNKAIKLDPKTIPDILLFDIDVYRDETDIPGLEDFHKIIEAHSSENRPKTTLITYSNDHSLHCKFKAARGEIDAFLTKPLKTDRLVMILDELVFTSSDNPLRVMIVDDTPSSASTISTFLEEAGINTLVILNPEHVVDMLSVFQPDLVLIDLYMPILNGDELVRAIRYHKKFDTLSLVYLSNEEDIAKQHKAIQCGADDFIPKSLPLETVALSVKAKARRARHFNTLLVKDKLTGLYNYSYCYDRLFHHMERAQRNQLPLTVALLVIDNYKQLNDQYGHSTGDNILQVISHILQHRLRKKDILGRSIGVGFFIIMPDTSEQVAFAIIDNLRKNFSKVEHEAQIELCDSDNKGKMETFQTTFSAGIAGFPKYAKANALITAAEDTLLKLERRGPNQVGLA